MLRLCKETVQQNGTDALLQCRCAPAILKGEANDLRAM
jgi:hypothetical protein